MDDEKSTEGQSFSPGNLQRIIDLLTTASQLISDHDARSGYRRHLRYD
jgi:hypothetical protein